MMPSFKDIRMAQKSAGQQQRIISDLNLLTKDIERCEKTILRLQEELAAVNAQFQGPRTTRQDVDYLSGLLGCAKKKLAWEKNLASLQKRTPEVLDAMKAALNDPRNPPDEAVRAQMLQALQGVQAAMERLQNVRVS